MLWNTCSPSRSFGEASGCGGLTDPGGLAVSVSAAFDSNGQMMASQATIANRIRIVASVLSGRDGRDRSMPSSPLSQLFQREHNQGAGVLRHALEGLAIKRDKLVGYQAAPSHRNGNVLLAAGHVADNAAVVTHAVVMVPELLAVLRIVGV